MASSSEKERVSHVREEWLEDELFKYFIRTTHPKNTDQSRSIVLFARKFSM